MDGATGGVHTSGMRGAVVAGLVVAALAGTASVASGAHAAPTSPPTLRLVRTPDVVVLGEHFKTDEHVTVTLAAIGFRVRHVTAVAGSFRASFGVVGKARCAPLRVLAIGSRGSRASLVVPAGACIQPAPPPGT